MADLWVDSRGFVWYGDFKLPCKYHPDDHTIEFYDKDKLRSCTRGTRLIRVPVDEFVFVSRKIRKIR